MKIPTVIRIKKRPLSGQLIWLLVLLPFWFGTMTELMGIPNGVRYVLDLAWVGLTVLPIPGRKHVPGALFLWVAAFGLVMAAAYVGRWQSGLYFLWGFRNNFRLYAAFFAFCTFLTREEGEGYLEKLEGLFRLNIPVTLFQFFALGKSGDYLGGLFGTAQGCNAYTNVFFCIVVTRSVVGVLEKGEPWNRCLGNCFWALLLAALGEIKFFFLEFGAIVILAAVFSGCSGRKFWLLAGGAVGILLGAVLLEWLFPNFKGWFSLKWLLDAAGSDRGYTSSGDLNRLNGIFVIKRSFFRTPGLRLLGLGLGNCDTSAFPFLNTPFYRVFSHLHYTWMSTSFWYLEGGWVGLVFFFGFFVLVFRAAGSACREGDALGGNLARIMAVICCMIGFYNASLRTEAAYMAYFVLALPFQNRRNP